MFGRQPHLPVDVVLGLAPRTIMEPNTTKFIFDIFSKTEQYFFFFAVRQAFARFCHGFYLEEAMAESGKSLSNSKKYCSVLEKISKINDVKQNEKHPFRQPSLFKS